MRLAVANFETFTRRATPVVLQPIVTFQRRGVLALNRAAFEALRTPIAVELLFDRANQVVGVRPSALDVPHAYRVRKQAGSATYLVAAKAFMQFYGIPSDRAHRYGAALVDGALVASLAGDRANER